MSALPMPSDELDRLAALRSYHILDTPPERGFDALAQLASVHFKVPIALISLVDSDRQWFKASRGMKATETPRHASFCAHAILRPDEVMVVENARLDPRFADNPLVCGEPSICFYAGAPVRAENGQPLGTLCVMDRKPRQLDPAGGRFLADLAANAGALLELHRKNLMLAGMSGHDPLTGLANRQIFDTELAVACSGAADGVPFGLVIIDLDEFKEINDTFGHMVGDSLLREVGQRLERVVRGGDLVARLRRRRIRHHRRGADRPRRDAQAGAAADGGVRGGYAARSGGGADQSLDRSGAGADAWHRTAGLVACRRPGAGPRQAGRAADVQRGRFT